MFLSTSTVSPLDFEHGEPCESVPPVYKVLATHQISDRWDLRDLLRELHRWVGIFVFEFKLTIPDVALRVEGLNWQRLGHFQRSHNGLGLEREIAINRRHIALDKEVFWEVLGTLLHEFV